MQVHLAGQGALTVAELDTTYFVGNSPGSAGLRGRDGDDQWFDVRRPNYSPIPGNGS